MPTSGDKKAFSVVQVSSLQARIIQFRLSPDGHWLAYSSTESGREEVYITHFPDGSGKWQVSETGGTQPVWRGDTREIYFVGRGSGVHAADVTISNNELSLGPVRQLFQITSTGPLGNPLDVTPDGRHFVLATMPESTPTPLVLVSNWTAEVGK